METTSTGLELPDNPLAAFPARLTEVRIGYARVSTRGQNIERPKFLQSLLARRMLRRPQESLEFRVNPRVDAGPLGGLDSYAPLGFGQRPGRSDRGPCRLAGEGTPPDVIVDHCLVVWHCALR